MNENEQLTREQAEACLKIVKDWVALYAATGWADEVKLYEPGFHCDGWAIWLEGLEDWPQAISHSADVTWPPGMYAGAVNHVCLGLYPQRNH